MGKDSPPATGRRTLPPASLRAPGTLGTLQPPRSLRPQRHPGRDLTRSSSQPAAGPGLDGTGRGRDGGGAVTQPRAGGRASGRARARRSALRGGEYGGVRGDPEQPSPWGRERTRGPLPCAGSLSLGAETERSPASVRSRPLPSPLPFSARVTPA